MAIEPASPSPVLTALLKGARAAASNYRRNTFEAQQRKSQLDEYLRSAETARSTYVQMLRAIVAHCRTEGVDVPTRVAGEWWRIDIAPKVGEGPESVSPDSLDPDMTDAASMTISDSRIADATITGRRTVFDPVNYGNIEITAREGDRSTVAAIRAEVANEHEKWMNAPKVYAAARALRNAVAQQALMLAPAVDYLKAVLQADPELAWAWHCNVAVPIMSKPRITHLSANLAAARVMEHLFDVDITTHPHYRHLIDDCIADGVAGASVTAGGKLPENAGFDAGTDGGTTITFIGKLAPGETLTPEKVAVMLARAGFACGAKASVVTPGNCSTFTVDGTDKPKAVDPDHTIEHTDFADTQPIHIDMQAVADAAVGGLTTEDTSGRTEPVEGYTAHDRVEIKRTEVGFIVGAGDAITIAAAGDMTINGQERLFFGGSQWTKAEQDALATRAAEPNRERIEAWNAAGRDHEKSLIRTTVANKERAFETRRIVASTPQADSPGYYDKLVADGKARMDAADFTMKDGQTGETLARIQPTIGRRVWYWPANDGGRIDFANLNNGSYVPQPFDAGIAYVHNDRMLNLTVADHHGNMHAMLSVPLVQAGETSPEGHFCCWMPYQTKAAKK